MTSNAKPFFDAAKKAQRRRRLEILSFLIENRKWRLVPVLVTSLLLAITAYLSTSAAAPFIYSLS